MRPRAAVPTHRYAYVVGWGNPYTEPPEGYERRGLRIELPLTRTTAHPRPPEIDVEVERLNAIHGTPDRHPWTIFCEIHPLKEPRRWPLARKQAMRRRNLRARLVKAAPLFADQEYTATLAARPEYYGAADALAPIVAAAPVDHEPDDPSPF